MLFFSALGFCAGALGEEPEERRGSRGGEERRGRRGGGSSTLSVSPTQFARGVAREAPLASASLTRSAPGERPCTLTFQTFESLPQEVPVLLRSNTGMEPKRPKGRQNKKTGFRLSSAGCQNSGA